MAPPSLILWCCCEKREREREWEKSVFALCSWQQQRQREGGKQTKAQQKCKLSPSLSHFSLSLISRSRSLVLVRDSHLALSHPNRVVLCTHTIHTHSQTGSAFWKAVEQSNAFLHASPECNEKQSKRDNWALSLHSLLLPRPTRSNRTNTLENSGFHFFFLLILLDD